MQAVRDEIVHHLPQDNEARRLFHGRGHCFPGYEDLVIDFFPPVVIVILYRQRAEIWLEELARVLDDTLPGKPETILLQERFLHNGPSRLLRGRLPDELTAKEEGLLYRLRPGQAQNIGFFLDMAIGRKVIHGLVAGKKVLNLFAYSCSFSIAALTGGASHVVNLDMNRGALELGKLNHRINGIELRRASFLSIELFRSLGKLRKIGPFDLVICDPPSSQGKSFNADQHWPKLVRSLPGLITPGGKALACLNSPRHGAVFIKQLFREHLPAAVQIESYFPGKDFPERDKNKGLSLHLYQLP